MTRTSTSPRRSAAAAACFLLASAAQAGDQEQGSLAARAVSANGEEAAQARASLRAAGPDGLSLLFEAHAAVLAEPRSLDDRHERAHAAVDTVAGQRHAAASRLYWYTDLEQARAQSRESGRPILSLRLLGRLDEELSCANSRFFRAVLYATPEVAGALRSRFVLHWSSERPAPRFTVDFGDGRRLEGTLTGNSIHYVLDAEGRPVDALPGLYGPRAFLEGLTRAEAAVKETWGRESADRGARLRRYHLGRMADLARRFRSEVAQAGLKGVPPLDELAAAPLPGEPGLRVLAADRIALGKSRVERPVLRSVLGPSAVPDAPAPEPWPALATLHLEALDASALARLREDGVDPLAEAETARNLQVSIAQDTVRNEYLLHSRLHRWLANGGARVRDLETLNERVYAELFLTPRSDPWLGLVAPNVYSGLRLPSVAAR